MAGEGDELEPQEEFLWQLAAVEDRPTETVDQESWSDDELIAYRRGELDGEASRRVEWLLTDDRRARQRLLELAEIELAPPAAVRGRVLQTLAEDGDDVVADRDTATDRGVDLDARVAPRRRGRRIRWLAPALAAAALLLAVLGPWSPWGRSALVDLPPGVAFELRVEGVSEVRSSESIAPDGGGEEEVTATPDQRLRLVIEAVETAVAGLDYGAYAHRADAWLRLGPGDGLEVERRRGAAVFEAPAGVLVGERPGRYDLLLAVAPEGQLPASLVVPTGSEPARVLAERSRGWVRRQTIHLVSDHDGDTGDRGD